MWTGAVMIGGLLHTSDLYQYTGDLIAMAAKKRGTEQ